MRIEFIVQEDADRANHMVWTVPDHVYQHEWFASIVKVVSDLVTEVAQPDGITCEVCHRQFKSPAALKQHKTVSLHNGE